MFQLRVSDFYCAIQEADGLLEQLSSEQGKVEALRSTVEQERAVIAQETAHVASLAEVRLINELQ